ncbi:heavy-metal-associated domain-containing protein [Puteibacter caeruleilacunae]|nr:heavy-metal-associated domain-containing protein [Puteibacter caeruleilacunae]
MKTLIQTMIKMTLMVSILIFASNTFAQDTKTKKENTVVFKVEMDCQGCAKKLEKNLPFEKGVKNLKVDFQDQKVTIVYKTKSTNKENLLKAIKKMQFKAEEVKKKA